MVLAGLVAELREHGKRPVDLFNACDTDRDGLISAEDFTAGLRQLDVDDPEETFHRLIDGGVAPLNYCDFSRRLRLIVREVSEAPPEQPRRPEAAKAHMPSDPEALQQKMQSLQATMQEARDHIVPPQKNVPLLEDTTATVALENLMLQAEEQARRLQAAAEDTASEPGVKAAMQAAVETALEAAVEAVVALDVPLSCTHASSSTAAQETTSRLEQRAEGLRQLMCALPLYLPHSPTCRPCERRVSALSARVRRLEAGPQLEGPLASELGGRLKKEPREAPSAPVARPVDQGSMQARLAVLEGLMGTAARVLAAAPQAADEDAELSAAATRVQAAAHPPQSRAAVEEAAAAAEAAASSAISEMVAAAALRDTALMAEVARLKSELGRGAKHEAEATRVQAAATRLQAATRGWRLRAVRTTERRVAREATAAANEAAVQAAAAVAKTAAATAAAASAAAARREEELLAEVRRAQAAAAAAKQQAEAAAADAAAAAYEVETRDALVAAAIAQGAEASVRAELLAERAAKELLLSELRAEREAELLAKVTRLEGQLVKVVASRPEVDHRPPAGADVDLRRAAASQIAAEVAARVVGQAIDTMTHNEAAAEVAAEVPAKVVRQVIEASDHSGAEIPSPASRGQQPSAAAPSIFALSAQAWVGSSLGPSAPEQAVEETKLGRDVRHEAAATHVQAVTRGRRSRAERRAAREAVAAATEAAAAAAAAAAEREKGLVAEVARLKDELAMSQVRLAPPAEPPVSTVGADNDTAAARVQVATRRRQSRPSEQAEATAAEQQGVAAAAAAKQVEAAAAADLEAAAAARVQAATRGQQSRASERARRQAAAAAADAEAEAAARVQAAAREQQSKASVAAQQVAAQAKAAAREAEAHTAAAAAKQQAEAAAAELRAEREAELLAKVARLEGQLAESRVATHPVARPRHVDRSTRYDDAVRDVDAPAARPQRRQQRVPLMPPLRAETRASSSLAPLLPEPSERDDGVCESCSSWIPRCICGAHHSQALIGRLKRKASAGRRAEAIRRRRKSRTRTPVHDDGFAQFQAAVYVQAAERGRQVRRSRREQRRATPLRGAVELEQRVAELEARLAASSQNWRDVSTPAARTPATAEDDRLAPLPVPDLLTEQISPLLQTRLFERALDASSAPLPAVRTSPFNAPERSPPSLTQARINEIVDDFAEQHREARLRCLVVAEPEVRAFEDMMRAVRQSQGSSTTPVGGSVRAHRGTQFSPAARSRNSGAARPTVAVTPPARTPKADKELAEWRELRDKARRQEAHEAEEARRIEQKLRWEEAAAEERLRQQMEYVQHSPFLNDPHARRVTPGAPGTPQGRRVADLPDAAAASLPSRPSRPSSPAASQQQRRFETTQPNYWRDQLQQERLTVQKAQVARARQEAAMVLQANARRRQARNAWRRAIVAARDEQQLADAYEELIVQVRAAVARRVEAKAVLMAGERGRRARRRVSCVRDEAEEQRWLAQQYDFLIEDVRKWAAEELWLRRDEAATSVQAFCRGNVGRRLVTQEWREKIAATLLQSSTRSKFARNAARRRRDVRRERQRQAAAVRVQAVHRGRGGRQDARGRRAARAQAELAEEHEAEEHAARRETAAVRIQAGLRGRRGRLDYVAEVTRRRAAVTVQSHVRGARDRRCAGGRLDAARCIQDRQRCKSQQRQAAWELEVALRGASTTIQRHARRQAAVVEVARRRQELVQLQRDIEGYALMMGDVRRWYEDKLVSVREAAATRVQAGERAAMARKRRVQLQEERDQMIRGAQAFVEQMAEVRAACEVLRAAREARAATRLQAQERGGTGRRRATEHRAARTELEWLARGYEQLLVEVRSENSRALLKRRYQAATLLGSWARGMSARRFVKQRRLEQQQMHALAIEYESLRGAVKAEVDRMQAGRLEHAAAAAAVRIQAVLRGLHGRWQCAQRREAREEQLALARDFEGLRTAVKAEVARMRAERLRRAALRLQAWQQGIAGRKRAAAARDVRNERQLRALEFDTLMAAVRAENERAAVARALAEQERKQTFAARTIVLLQARHRGVMGRHEYRRRKEAHEELVGLDYEFRGLMSAVRRATEDKWEAEARAAEEGALREAAEEEAAEEEAAERAQREDEGGEVEELALAPAADAFGMASRFVQWSGLLFTQAESQPAEGWGFASFGATFAPSELQELLSEAAMHKALSAHTHLVPSRRANVEGDAGDASLPPPPQGHRVTVFDHSAAEQDRALAFPLLLETPLVRRRALLRQEFRGLTVHVGSGTLLARPLHKFWHVGQRAEMRAHEEQWLLQPRHRLTLLEKVNGEMVHYWMLEGELHASAAGGPSEASAEAARFAEESDAKGALYREFCREAIEGGFTPVFAWSRGARDAHGDARLVLLALRHMGSGHYVPHRGLVQLAAPYGVPTVARLAVTAARNFEPHQRRARRDPCLAASRRTPNPFVL